MPPVPSPTTPTTQVNANAAGSGSGAVTVPADANAVVALWGFANGGTSLQQLGSASIGGTGLTIVSQKPDGSPDNAPAVGVAAAVLPGTGSQTFAWAWSAGVARAEGGLIVLVWIKDANTTSLYRAGDSNHTTGTTDVAVTGLPTSTTDLVVALAMTFDSPNDIDFTAPTVTLIDNANLNTESYDVATFTPVGSTITIAMTGEFYSGMAAISLRAIGDNGSAGRTTKNTRSRPLGIAAGVGRGVNLPLNAPMAYSRRARLYVPERFAA